MQEDNKKMINSIAMAIDRGDWQESKQEINRLLSSDDCDEGFKEQLLYQQERMRRITLDFCKSRTEILEEVKAELPEVTEALFDKWERAFSIEHMIIDGEKRYFRNATRNVFLVNEEARTLKQKGEKSEDEMLQGLKPNIRQIIDHFDRTGDIVNSPKNISVQYTLTVNPGAVKDGETVRTWLAFPKDMERQKNIRLISSDPREHILASDNSPQRTVYLEKRAEKDKPLSFTVNYELTSYGFFNRIDPDLVDQDAMDRKALLPFLIEREPHILFSESIKKLSHHIAGNEPNPYLKARRFFQWIRDNIPWASAREYSTFTNIPEYCIKNGWGDCGIVTLTFMTLCRYNGIPARWESGWTSDPVYRGMHDWCQIYIHPYGWIPVDVSLGMVDSDDETEKWFFFGNTDSYRIVCNSDFSQPLYPEKRFFRSEPIDNQRGEVETGDSNLYFNEWSYRFQITEREI